MKTSIHKIITLSIIMFISFITVNGKENRNEVVDLLVCKNGKIVANQGGLYQELFQEEYFSQNLGSLNMEEFEGIIEEIESDIIFELISYYHEKGIDIKQVKINNCEPGGEDCFGYNIHVYHENDSVLVLDRIKKKIDGIAWLNEN